ncbi:DUF3800 domain-containing protein [Actinobacillus equuli subsp. haemolyticus]|uniref:DUF3800 domain-containing protein n=1 Tax=Actinobacillus equuli TaxID=718 RepID=UPI00244366ED|nr:DUF3800 domain-containing protein [Actinobacillus equuli]WGE70503.1 DUF3800 domain-containing protein [Actinobacillus equuli subsp. haemolyticus]
MYFYIDESGHSGVNLFDQQQPYLYYGIISSPFDLDNLAHQDILNLKNTLSVNELHANELGNKELIKIITDLEKIYHKYNINFDVCRVNKKDFAMISFFDQIFDQGVNPSVPWTYYWTPLRYPLLLTVSTLFDDELIKQAWKARININTEKAQQNLVNICKILLDKIINISDKRAIDIISNAITWAMQNPDKIRYNVFNKNNILEISPNIISFQSVLFLICHRIRESGVNATKIIVDIQSEFNRTQDWLTKLYQSISKNSDEPLQIGPSMPNMNLENMPAIDIDYKESGNSVGLQLVDIHLWICRRFLENKSLAEELKSFFEANICNTLYNEISLKSISQRWAEWFSKLPEPSELDLERGRRFHNLVEERRRPYIIR